MHWKGSGSAKEGIKKKGEGSEKSSGSVKEGSEKAGRRHSKP